MLFRSKKFIAVKISGCIRRDKALAKEALSILQDSGYEVIQTAQGIVVRIPR